MTLIIGIPPATEASKKTGLYFLLKILSIWFPFKAIKALFAVTNGLCNLLAALNISNASLVPPISSTTISTCGLSTSFNGFEKNLILLILQFLFFNLDLAQTEVTSKRYPEIS